MNTNNDTTYFQTGDLLYFQTEAIPKKGVTRIKSGVLLHSDTTGHAHVVKGGALFRDKAGKMFISVPKKATLAHEEHKDLVLPKGNYEVKVVQEYDHAAEEARNVID